MTVLSGPEARAVDAYLLRSAQVVSAEQLMLQPQSWPVGTLIVVDATDVQSPSLPLLARVVQIHRELRARGGDLVLAANSATATLLRSNGLHRAVPWRRDVVTALAALDHAPAVVG